MSDQVKEVKEAKPEKIPINFQLGDKMIDGATVKPLSFQAWSDCINEAIDMTEPKDFVVRVRRLRMSKQVNYHVNGSIVPVAPVETLRLSIPDARKILNNIDSKNGKPGKVIREGDGINKSIVFELGTPISMGAGKPPITELEFQASTYGEIEEVLAASIQVQQTARLIATVAKPVGTSLQVLPSSVLNQITMADGTVIMNEVLPHFLEPEVES